MPQREEWTRTAAEITSDPADHLSFTNQANHCVKWTERFACLALSNNIVKLLLYCWTQQTLPQGWTPPSQISPITMQRRLAYENDSLRYVMKGAESEQPVGAPFHQWVGCRGHAGIACFPHSGSWQAQGGPAYIQYVETREKCGFHNMGPLTPTYPPTVYTTAKTFSTSLGWSDLKLLAARSIEP